MPDVYVTCEVCQGKQYNQQALEVLFNGKSIADVLAMSVAEAVQFFSFMPGLAHKLATLQDVGLSYIKLGQPAPTLSGGEAQRIKLAAELSKRGKDSLYILDEPTTGLHFADVEKLLAVLKTRQVREMKPEDISEKLSELKLELLKDQGNVKMGRPIKNTGKISGLRKAIARNLTIQNERRSKMKIEEVKK